MVSETFSVGELAELGGVSRRTVRYYVQEGLIESPDGLGRGARYHQAHLDQLLRVKALQEQGLTLNEVRVALRSSSSSSIDAVFQQALEHPSPSRSHWMRLAMAPGIELHVSSQHQIPSPARLEDLAEWCRRYVRPRKEKKHDQADD